jgi:hypothetical protein
LRYVFVFVHAGSGKYLAKPNGLARNKLSCTFPGQKNKITPVARRNIIENKIIIILILISKIPFI